MIRPTRWLSVLALVLAAPGVRAEPSAPLLSAPLPSAEKQSLDAFAAANASCLEWSDGCVVCLRRDSAADKGADKGAPQNGAFACSTPGIACTPAKLACRTPPPKP